MKVCINGEMTELDQSLSIEELITNLKLRKESVVCELNRSVLSKTQYGETYLKENDSLEIVHFVGGG